MTPHQPDSLPLDNLDYRQLFSLVGEANAELARYDGLLQGIPNPAVMLSPLTTQEAVLSSKIEGTQATVDEVLEQEAGLTKEGEKFKDIQEISNYRTALFQASEHLKDYPIRLSLIRELHGILLNSVRGQNKSPGDFRNDQNWIGRAGCTVEQATFVPPSPLALAQHLEDWERYLDFDDSDFLLQVAVVHAQFELLHPFKDGNGRIGRILIPLFLYQKKALSQPMFYLSEYLEAHRDEYYQRLQAISTEGDWNGWIAFFLKAITLQARENSLRVKAIMALYEQMKHRIHDITHSQYSVHLLDALFSRPIFKTTDVIQQFESAYGIHPKTTPGLLRQLKEAGILLEIKPGSGRRAAVLCFPELLELAEGRAIFER
ncbi:Fic/DOC family N-terminal domain-containing protein [Parendozoicomonas sp. Alg238-R29]|uniref:Fic family protein n=1 Tax=Parendozoicomonas sp. Alg238-R29 TaxID=2993446 RepID=UPI00248F1378|nr:Fic/DOC family N-terminal domain-containing protein [Parendozoicomonas sp. Alg238-R29]